MNFVSSMFPDQSPLFVSVAEKHGYGEILDLLLEKAFTKGEAIQDLRAVQAILLVASMRCSSNYCSVFHSLIMNTLGVDAEEIEYIVSHHRFPDSLAEFRQYEEFLRYAFFRKNLYITDDYSYVAQSHFRNEAPSTRDFLTILLLSDLLLMLTVAFDDEVNLDIETFFRVYPTQDHVGDYVKYFTQQKAKSRAEGAPTFSICMHCKGVKNQKTLVWQPIETMIGLLPQNARFSHGLCPPCFRDEEEMLEAEGELAS